MWPPSSVGTGREDRRQGREQRLSMLGKQPQPPPRPCNTSPLRAGAAWDEAQRQLRQLDDDNHVGTGHIALGVLITDRGVADILARHGITQEVFRDQLFEESGPSPAGQIPRASYPPRLLT